MKLFSKGWLSLVLAVAVLIGSFSFLIAGGVLRGVMDTFKLMGDLGISIESVKEALSGNLGGGLGALFPLGGDDGGDDDGGDPPYVPSVPAVGEISELSRVLTDTLVSLEDEVDISALGLSKDEVREHMNQFLFTNPQFFYVSTGYEIQTDQSTGEVHRIRFHYVYEEEVIPVALAQYESIIDQIVAGAPESGSEFECVLYLHDYLIKNFSYDYRPVSDDQLIRDAYRFFTEKTGVCQAYMLAFIALCTEMGIECLPVTSEEMKHAWNLVKLDGEWYHVDVTFDDAGGETSPVYPCYTNYRYFLLSSEALWSSGRQVLFTATEQATDTRYDNALWHGANTPMIKHGEEYFFAIWDELEGTAICRGTPEAQSKVKYLTDARWQTEGGFYCAAWVSLVSHGDVLIFNTNDSFCTFDPVTGLVNELDSLGFYLGTKQIFGISAYDGTYITYVAAQGYHGVFDLRTYRISV